MAIPLARALRLTSASPLVRQAVVLLPLFACRTSPPPPTNAATSLAALGPQITLMTTLSNGHIDVALGESDPNDPGTASCPVVNASATLNGQPMTVTSAGSGALEPEGGSDGCGDAEGNACTVPSFGADFDPVEGSEVDLRIADSTATFVFRAEIAKPTITIDPPNGGNLPIGEATQLALSPPPTASSDLIFVFRSQTSADAGSSVVFACDTEGDELKAGCFAQLSPTGASLFVTDAVPPQAGILEVEGLPPTVTLECTGVAHCEMSVAPSPTADLSTAVEP